MNLFGKILNLLVFFLIFFFLSSCEDATNLFAEYEGRDLIADYQFGATIGSEQVWQPDHEGSNDYMTWEALSGTELDDARDVRGLPDGDINIYRLEVKNQFINGDFEATTPLPITAVSDIAGMGIWNSTRTTVSNDMLWVDTVDDNNYLEFNQGGDTLYIDLTEALNSYNEVEEYSYYIEFIISGDEVSFDDGNPGIRFAFDNEPPSGENKIVHRLSGNKWFFPGGNGIENRWEKSPQRNRLYFGRPNVPFATTIDNIRFVGRNINYAVRFLLPNSENERISLNYSGGKYTFSVYVKGDPTVGTSPGGDNRFAAKSIAMEIKVDYPTLGDEDDGENSQSMIRNFVLDDDSRWQRFEMTITDFFVNKQLDNSSEGARMELAITASALSSGSGGDANTIFKLDAGSVLVAVPSLYFSSSR